MEIGSRIYVAGHAGLVGSAIVRALERRGYPTPIVRTREELNLRDQQAVERFFETERPEFVFLAAAKVGGIAANMAEGGEFIYDNLAIQTNVLHAAWKHGVRRLLFLGSSCIYPRECPQPIREEYLLTGPLEPTNEPYAIAKIAGLKMCEAYNRQYGTSFRCAMPTNLYGPNDNFDPESSHVLPALIRRVVEARDRGESCVEIWGSGAPRREFLHAGDAAEALLHLMQLSDATWRALGVSHVNVGYGSDISIAELARLVIRLAGYRGDLRFNTARPDGMPQKFLDSSRLQSLGWRPRIALEEGICEMIAWFERHDRLP